MLPLDALSLQGTLGYPITSPCSYFPVLYRLIVVADFIVSKETQAIIKTFGVEKFGSPLFFPDAGKKDEDLGK